MLGKISAIEARFRTLDCAGVTDPSFMPRVLVRLDALELRLSSAVDVKEALCRLDALNTRVDDLAESLARYANRSPVTEDLLGVASDDTLVEPEAEPEEVQAEEPSDAPGPGARGSALLNVDGGLDAAHGRQSPREPVPRVEGAPVTGDPLLHEADDVRCKGLEGRDPL